MIRQAPLTVLAAVALSACSPKAPPQPPAPAVAAEPAAPASRLMSPADYVKGFYVKEPLWGTPEERRALFEPALAEALIRDSSSPDEVGAVDFSFFCGCQDGEITDVTTTSRDIPGGYEVTARFALEGKPTVVVYRLLTTGAGYRIVDVSAPAQNGGEGWSLRGLLGMDKTA